MIELNTIYNESCLETLKKIPDRSIDLVITSPPYNMNLRIKNGKYCKRHGGKNDVISNKYVDEFKDDLTIEEYNKFHSHVLDELLRTSELIFYNIQLLTGSKRSLFKMIGDYSDVLKDIIIWDKGSYIPATQPQVLSKQVEYILVFDNDYPISRQFRNKGKFKSTLSEVFHVKREINNCHGATFPEALVSKILRNFSEPGDIVYDCFSGSGTTCKVCAEMNRNYIGSELSKKYYDYSIDRLKTIQRGLFNGE